MTNLTEEFNKVLENSVKELTDLLEAKDFENAIAASKEISTWLKECSKLCSSSEELVLKIENFAEQANKKSKQPIVAMNHTGIEALFQKLDPTIKVDVRDVQEDNNGEKIGKVSMFTRWREEGMRRNKKKVEVE